MNVAALTAVYSGTLPTEWPATALKTYALTVTNDSTRTRLATGTDRVQLQATFSGQSPVTFALLNDVAPGASVTINVTMTAPSIADAGTLVHRLVLANGTSFVSNLTTNVDIGTLAASYTAAPPTVWQPSQTQTFNVTVTNTGTSPWRTTSNPTRLGVYFHGNSDAIGDWTVAPQLVPLTADVLPGQSLTVSVTTTAPAASGSYVLRLRMNTENASWFTQLAKTNILVGTKAATYSVPTPSTADWWTAESRTTSITVTNTGTLAWNATGTDVTRLGYYFVPTSQVGLPAVTAGTFVPLPNNVSPGQAVTITVPVI